MKIGIVVFAYNRPQHLSRVLKGLQQNENVQNIYIFQDGLKKEEHREAWELTQKVIRAIDWCNVKYILSPINKGLAKSIMEGITKIFETNEAAIILEDDCVPSSDYVKFMKQCLEQYKDNHKVYSVTGYGYPAKLHNKPFDAYFIGRGSSWGWGTWRDRWEVFSPDRNIIDRIKRDEKKSVYLAKWGNDLEQMLCNRLEGKNDSWAVYWALHIIDHMGVNVVPYQSYIRNIGMDGTGVHCKITDRYDVFVESQESSFFSLPEEIVICDEASKLFINWFGGYTVNNIDVEKEHILVYGLGAYFQCNEKYICENYYIEAFIDQEKTGYYAGKRVIKPCVISKYEHNKICIMLRDIQECQRVACELHNNYGILSQNIGIFTQNGWKGYDSFC